MSEDNSQLHIILWNISMTPSAPPNFGTRAAKERVPAIAGVLNQYDIAVVNESFLYRDTLLSHMKGHPYVYTDPRIWYKPLNSGVLIISKRPLSDTNYFHYSQSSNWDQLTSKGLVGASFFFAGEIFELYGTHMQAGNRDVDHKARFSQAAEIVDHVARSHNPDFHLIICGDFNCGPTLDPEFKRFSGHYSDERDARLRDAQYRVIRDGTGTTQLTLGERDEDICSFFYKGGPNLQCKVQRAEAAPNSDGISDTGTLCITITREEAI
jgi:exonuclease III